MRCSASRRRQLFRFASLLSITFIAAASCSNGPSSSIHESSSGDDSNDELAVVVPLPLSNVLFRSTDSERVTFTRQQDLIRQCMNDRGFAYPSIRFVAQPTELTLERPFGVWLQAEAQTRGYHGPLVEEPDEALDTLVAGLGTAEQSMYLYAFNGVGAVPTGRSFPNGLPVAGTSGCLQAALDAIFGDYASYEGDRVLVQKLVNDAYAIALGDKAVVQALSAWKHCMRKAGYDLRSPDEALQAAQLGDAPKANEVKQALADVECKAKSGLMSSWYQAKQAAEQSLLEENVALVERLREYRSREAK